MTILIFVFSYTFPSSSYSFYRRWGEEVGEGVEIEERKGRETK